MKNRLLNLWNRLFPKHVCGHWEPPVPAPDNELVQALESRICDLENALFLSSKFTLAKASEHATMTIRFAKTNYITVDTLRELFLAATYRAFPADGMNSTEFKVTVKSN